MLKFSEGSSSYQVQCLDFFSLYVQQMMGVFPGEGRGGHIQALPLLYKPTPTWDELRAALINLMPMVSFTFFL